MKKQILTIISAITIGLNLNAQVKTDSTKNAKVAVAGAMIINSAPLDELRLQTASIDRLNILPNGRVGIGTATPASKFHVRDVTGTIATLESSSNKAYLSILTPTGGSIGGVLFENPTNFFKGFLNYDHFDDRMIFGTANTGRMTINSTGNVGIGTSTPNSKFHIMGTSSNTISPLAGTMAILENSAGAYLSINSGTSSVNGVNFGNPTNNQSGFITYSNSSNDLRLGTNSLPRMIIDGPTGNLGIGTITPDAKLDVNGDFALSKKVLLSGNGGHVDYDRLGASIISIETPANGGGGETLSGIKNGVDGLIIHLYPIKDTSLTLLNESGSSLEPNRIILHTGSTITFSNNGGCTLIYDGNAQRWRVIGMAN